MKLYFIRHGETRLNVEQRYQGRQDVPLNDTGREQMRRTAGILAGIQPDAVYASPLLRAVQSAEIVTEGMNVEILPLDWLMEVFHGEVEGMSKPESDAVHPGLHELWNTKPDQTKFPGGESLADVAARVSPGLESLANSGMESVFLVSHQVIIAVARCIIQGRPLSEIWQNKLLNGAVLELEVAPGFSAGA